MSEGNLAQLMPNLFLERRPLGCERQIEGLSATVEVFIKLELSLKKYRSYLLSASGCEYGIRVRG